MDELDEALKATVALVAVVNPLASLPTFLALTRGQASERRRRTALLTVAAVVATCGAAAAVGEWLLLAFGIHVESFRIAGGLVILLTALGMLRDAPAGERSAGDDPPRPREPHEVAIVPLAMPLLAGPGAITTIIVYLHHVPGAAGYATIAVAIAALAAVLWFTLALAQTLEARLGEAGLAIVSRVMAILLAAVAVEFILAALVDLAPVFRFPADP